MTNGQGWPLGQFFQYLQELKVQNNFQKLDLIKAFSIFAWVLISGNKHLFWQTIQFRLVKNEFFDYLDFEIYFHQNIWFLIPEPISLFYKWMKICWNAKNPTEKICSKNIITRTDLVRKSCLQKFVLTKKLIFVHLKFVMIMIIYNGMSALKFGITGREQVRRFPRLDQGKKISKQISVQIITVIYYVLSVSKFAMSKQGSKD